MNCIACYIIPDKEDFGTGKVIRDRDKYYTRIDFPKTDIKSKHVWCNSRASKYIRQKLNRHHFI